MKDPKVLPTASKTSLDHNSKGNPSILSQHKEHGMDSLKGENPTYQHLSHKKTLPINPLHLQYLQ